VEIDSEISETGTANTVKNNCDIFKIGNIAAAFGENSQVADDTRTVETKLPKNDHWKVLYKGYVFYVDRKSKMATTAGHRLTLDPMGKCSNAFFSETTPSNDHSWAVWFQCPSGFREEAF
jgi:hypothetical protein